MKETPLDVIAAFLVVLTKDGGVDLFTSDMPPVRAERAASLGDIESAAQRLVAESGRALLQRALQQAPEPKAADVVAEALAKRAEK
jgi:hypothetical protein